MCNESSLVHWCSVDLLNTEWVPISKQYIIVSLTDRYGHMHLGFPLLYSWIQSVEYKR